MRDERLENERVIAYEQVLRSDLAMKDLGLVVVEGVETSDEALRQREEPIPVELPVRVVGQNLHAGTAQ